MMPRSKSISAFAPATVANVACGFDIFGFALERPGDLVRATIGTAPGVTMGEITGDDGALEAASENVAAVAARAVLNRSGINTGVTLSLRKGIPLSSGLGGSAASAVAAAVAVDALLEAKLPPDALLDCALEGERAASGARHADNAAPSLHGGFVLVRPAEPIPNVIPVPVPPGLTCVILHPHTRLYTSEGRKLLKDTVPLRDVVTQTANAAGLIAGLHTGDWELIRNSLTDVIIESQRRDRIPAFTKTQSAALNAGALGCSISGSGPSVFALCRDSATTAQVAARMADAFRQQSDLHFDMFTSGISQTGARVVPDGEIP